MQNLSISTQITEIGTSPEASKIYCTAKEFLTNERLKTNPQKSTNPAADTLKVTFATKSASQVNAKLSIGGKDDEVFYQWANDYLNSLDR